MGNTLMSLLVSLGVDSSDLDAGLQKAEKKASSGAANIGAGLASIGAGVAMGIGAAGVAAGVALASTIGPASDLGEALNAVNVVFGENADQIKAFGENSAMAVGLSTREFSQLSAEMGAMLKNVGVSEDELSGKTVDLVKRASDMASIFNTDVGQAFNAMQSAIKGEFNPLEAFGVKMNAAMIEAKALEMGLADVNGVIDDSAKAEAALALMMEQTDQVAGDFQNTAGGWANSQRQMAAMAEDLKAKIGAGLLPAMEGFAATIKEIAASPEFQAFLESLIAGVAKLGAWIAESIPIALAKFKEFGAWLSENQGVVVGVLAALGVALIAFGISAAIAAATALAPLLPVIAVMALIGLAAYGLYEAWTKNMGGIQEKTKAIWDAIVQLWNAFVAIFTPLVEAWQAAFAGDWETFGAKIREFWDNIWKLISAAVDGAIEWFKSVDWGQVGLDIIKGIANGITAGVEWIVKAAKAAANAAVDAAKGFLGIHSPSTLFMNIGENLMQGMAIGINQGANLPELAMVSATSGISAPSGLDMQALLNGASSRGGGYDEDKLGRIIVSAMQRGEQTR